jgi:hypothetical protein
LADVFDWVDEAAEKMVPSNWQLDVMAEANIKKREAGGRSKRLKKI